MNRLWISKQLKASWIKQLKETLEGWDVAALDCSEGGARNVKPSDIVLCSERDGWTQWHGMAPRCVFVVCAQLPKNPTNLRVMPFFVSHEQLSQKKGCDTFAAVLKQLVGVASETLNQSQEIFLRVQELSIRLGEQERFLRSLLRTGLRRSFPRHRNVDATVQYVDWPESEGVHFFDVFGRDDSRFIWSFGLYARSFGQSAEMMELIAKMQPETASESGSCQRFMDEWRCALGDLECYDPTSALWTWVFFDTQDGTVQAYGNKKNAGYLSVWSDGDIECLPVTVEKHTKGRVLGRKECVLLSTTMLPGDHKKTLQQLEKHFLGMDIPFDTALSHLHEQFLVFLHHQLKEGGASLMLRLREDVARKVVS